MKKVTLGQIDLSFHHASAGVYLNLLQHWNYTVEVKSGKHEDMFAQFIKGETDLLLSAWLPGSHAKYLEGFDDYEKLSVIYEPYCIWGVPNYVPESEVSCIQDLAKPEVAQRFNSLIQGINEGAGISRFSREIVVKYQLDKVGFHFENGSLEDCINTFRNAEKAKQWALIPLWYPQYMHHQTQVRVLKDPDNMLRGADEATTLLRKGADLYSNQVAIDTLKNVYLGNDAISEIDYYMYQGQTALEAAGQWIQKKFGGIEPYINHLATSSK